MPKKSTQKTTPETPIAAETAPAGSEAEYERFIPEARKIPAALVRPMRADVSLAITNAERGASAVLAKSERLGRDLPGVSVASISGISALGLALAYASGTVERWAPPPSDMKKLLALAHGLRGLMLCSADALAKAGVLPVAAVARIREGHGGIDTAGDCVALAALFAKNAALVRGKTPVSADEVREAAEVGARLLTVLQPKGARRKPAGDEISAAVDARDRLWTLFERTWEDQVWRAGAWLFGRAVDLHVPPLQSRVAGKRRATPPVTTTPAPTIPVTTPA